MRSPLRSRATSAWPMKPSPPTIRTLMAPPDPSLRPAACSRCCRPGSSPISPALSLILQLSGRPPCRRGAVGDLSDRHPGALVGQPLHDRLTDAIGRTRDGNDFARVFAAHGSSRGYRTRYAATSASRRLALNPKAMLPLIMTPTIGARGENAGINDARDDGVHPW